MPISNKNALYLSHNRSPPGVTVGSADSASQVASFAAQVDPKKLSSDSQGKLVSMSRKAVTGSRRGRGQMILAILFTLKISF